MLYGCVCTGANIPGLRFRVFLASTGGTEYIKDGMQVSFTMHKPVKSVQATDTWIDDM